MNKLKELIGEYKYRNKLPIDAIEYAKKNNLIILIGASDDLCEIYGMKCDLTNYGEIDCYKGRNFVIEDLKDYSINEDKWAFQAKEIGLKIYWCNECIDFNTKIKELYKEKNYTLDEYGAFTFKVDNKYNSLEFKVLLPDDEILNDNKIYCTGLIVKLD